MGRVCETCGRDFGAPSKLSRHRAQVHGEGKAKPYSCVLCRRSFRVESELQVHVSVCQTFSCWICKRRFRSQAELTAHRVIHRLKCPTCKVRFVTEEDHLRHLHFCRPETSGESPPKPPQQPREEAQEEPPESRAMWTAQNSGTRGGTHTFCNARPLYPTPSYVSPWQSFGGWHSRPVPVDIRTPEVLVLLVLLVVSLLCAARRPCHRRDPNAEALPPARLPEDSRP